SSSFNDNAKVHDIFNNPNPIDDEINVQELISSKEEPESLLKRKKKAPLISTESKGSVKRKNRSKWWDHFDKINETIATCKYYKTKIGCETKYRTNPLSNHIKRNDWKMVGTLLPFLNIFYDATLRLSGSRYVTCNSYVHEIYGTNFMIKSNLEDEDEGIKNMARQMKAKYEKYYGNVENINVLVFGAVILNPRHKMTYVEWLAKDNYEPNKLFY
ncbi:putative AC transposase, partial [Bienertia sinuspersici]